MKTMIFTLASFISFALMSQNPYEYSGTHSISKGKTLFLSSEDADVTIKGTNRSDVQIDIYRNAKGNLAKKQEFSFDIEERNGNLYLTEVKKSDPVTFFGYINIKEYSIDLLVPNNIHLNIEGEDDDYKIEEITGDITIDTEDGDILISEATSDMISIESEDGDFNLYESTGSLKYRGEDGDIEIYESDLEDLIIKTEDGDVRTKETTSGMTKIDSEDGDINLDVVKGDFFADIEDGDIAINEVHSLNLEIDGQDGSVTLSGYLNDKNDYKIKLEDGKFDFNLLEGGGVFEIKCGDGNVHARNNTYSYTTDEDHYKVLETDSGQAKVVVRTADGSVRLSK